MYVRLGEGDRSESGVCVRLGEEDRGESGLRSVCEAGGGGQGLSRWIGIFQGNTMMSIFWGSRASALRFFKLVDDDGLAVHI